MDRSETDATTTAQDMNWSRQWARQYLAQATTLPISFRFDDKAICGIPTDWGVTRERRSVDANITEIIYDGRDDKTGLAVRVEVQEYLDYPVVEWTAWFRNTGRQATPVLSEIMGLDSRFTGARPVLHHCNGDFCSERGYSMTETPLVPGTSQTLGPSGGRGCDQAFPYFRLTFAPEGGLSLAAGWPCQWSATFTGEGDGVHVRSGQEKTHLRLMPGETIRTPRMSVLFWTGGERRAANLWRRWYRDHVLPRPNGKPLGPLQVGHGTDEGEEFTAATEENQIRFMDRWVRHGVAPDVWWIDAGWYTCMDPRKGQRSWPYTGTWRPDPERFPKGLRPVSDHAASLGADLLVWFEPERVVSGTELDREHPEWLLKIPGVERALLNLGNPECRRWLTDHVCKMIQEGGIKIYRQDHNFAPLQFWRQNEAEDRQGLNENLHVQGYLQYWDDLLERNPGLWIDSCASGGRRNDLETMRRSVPLHYTDYGYGEHPVKLAFHHVLFDWLPYFKEVPLSWDLSGKSRYEDRVDSFSYHCGLGPMILPCIDIQRKDYDFALMRKMLGIWRRAAEFMLNGDYYPLTEPHRSPERWVARQFDCPESGQGFVQAIRLPQCSEESLVVSPQSICRQATYRLENPETGEVRKVAGLAMESEGLRFSLPKRQGAIWFYRIK